MRTWLLGVAVSFLSPAIAQALSGAVVKAAMAGLLGIEKLPGGLPLATGYNAQTAADREWIILRNVLSQIEKVAKVPPGTAADIDRQMALNAPRIPVKRAEAV
jgi:hypothetical protein